MSADPAHIRPEIKREVDSFLAVRLDLHRAERELRLMFERRMRGEGLTVSELRLVIDALERKD